MGVKSRSTWIAGATLVILFTAACVDGRRVSEGGRGAYEASLTRIGDGFAVAWYDDRDGNAEICCSAGTAAASTGLVRFSSRRSS